MTARSSQRVPPSESVVASERCLMWCSCRCSVAGTKVTNTLYPPSHDLGQDRCQLQVQVNLSQLHPFIPSVSILFPQPGTVSSLSPFPSLGASPHRRSFNRKAQISFAKLKGQSQTVSCFNSHLPRSGRIPFILHNPLSLSVFTLANRIHFVTFTRPSAFDF